MTKLLSTTFFPNPPSGNPSLLIEYVYADEIDYIVLQITEELKSIGI